MRRKLFAVLAALVMMVFAVNPASAVMFGTPDTENQYSYVGLIVFYDEAGTPTHRCTGTLISPTVVLTAGHCTYGAASARVYFEPTAPSTYPTSGGVTGEPIAHPNYDDFEGFPNTYDVGVVILDEAVDGPYAELAPVGTLDEMATRRGRQNVSFDIVGYGLQGVKPVLIAERTRYYGTVQLINLRSALTGGYNLQVTSAPGTGGGLCFGDSGGAVFLEGTSTIVAVNSFVLNSQCRGSGFSYRVETQEIHDWISQYL